MSDRNPIEQGPSAPEGRRLRCEEWESLTAEALDGTLPAAASAAFIEHRRECAACARMIEEARKGMEWLGFLDRQPEMPPDLVAKILTRTGGAAYASPAGPARIAGPAASWAPGWRHIAPLARRTIESRRIMTTAMAFFSIALTLNLTGVKLSDVRLSDLRPAAVGANLTRQYYSAKEQGVKYYDNLRFVYEMEARVRELRRTTETVPAPAPAPQRQSPSSRNDDNRAPGSRSSRAGGPSAPRPEAKPIPLAGDRPKDAVLVNEITRGALKPQGQNKLKALKSERDQAALQSGQGRARAQAERSLA